MTKSDKRLYMWVFAALVAVILLASWGIKYAENRYTCYSKWVDSSIESKYTVRGGCLVNYKGDWIPSENFRVN